GPDTRQHLEAGGGARRRRFGPLLPPWMPSARGAEPPPEGDPRHCVGGAGRPVDGVREPRLLSEPLRGANHDCNSVETTGRGASATVVAPAGGRAARVVLSPVLSTFPRPRPRAAPVTP